MPGYSNYIFYPLKKCGLFFIVAVLLVMQATAKDISFCGEQVPVNNSFVAEKLMNIIRNQIPYVNLPDLRQRADKYFPLIEYYLKATNLPDDLKYIPIVESGFRNASSKAGAQGFWQLMAPTAVEWGLRVNSIIDERNDINKATLAACKELARLYKSIRRDHGVSSWVLSAAAYNYGIGNMYNKMEKQGNDYFSMKLNPETAVYVYKIIAVKELFEYPELYIKNFQYNVFSRKLPALPPLPRNAASEDSAIFRNVELTIKQNDGRHPQDLTINNVRQPKDADLQKERQVLGNAKLAVAQLVGEYPSFKDGDSLVIILQENIQTANLFQRQGTEIAGRGWIIGDRVFVDLGFEEGEVILYDAKSRQGIPLNTLKDKQQLILRIQN